MSKTYFFVVKRSAPSFCLLFGRIVTVTENESIHSKCLNRAIRYSTNTSDKTYAHKDDRTDSYN